MWHREEKTVPNIDSNFSTKFAHCCLLESDVLNESQSNYGVTKDKRALQVSCCWALEPWENMTYIVMSHKRELNRRVVAICKRYNLPDCNTMEGYLLYYELNFKSKFCKKKSSRLKKQPTFNVKSWRISNEFPKLSERILVIAHRKIFKYTYIQSLFTFNCPLICR